MFNKKFNKPPTDKQILGKTGEDYACDYLRKSGYIVVERNYLKKWGELDIVAKKEGRIHFIEVKTVSRTLLPGVTYETLGKREEYRPEDNMHPWKLKRLGRAVQSYLLERNVPDDIDWQFDVVTVYVDSNKGLYKVFLLEDIVL